MEQEIYNSVSTGDNGRGAGEHSAQEKWVHDSSFDYKGRLPLRSSTGVWKASLFIITIEFSERLSYFGLATNLITYLTQVIDQDLKTAAKNVNCWTGVTTVMPLIGGFLADAYTGRFTMVLFSSFIYIMGLVMLTISQMSPRLKACNTSSCNNHSRKIHELTLFLALYCISVGTGGYKPCLESFGADQFDDNHSKERLNKMSYFNWWNFALSCGLLLGTTVIVYIQDNVNWGVADLILTITMAITVVIFYLGRPYFRYRPPTGSPFTPMFQVFFAAFKKRNLSLPTNPSLLYEPPMFEKSQQGRLLCHTNRLRCLDKAAIIEDNVSLSEQKDNPWRLATVTKLEELKLILNAIPIWLTSLTFGVCVSQSATFFVKQAAVMNLNITHSFKIPPASIYCLGGIAMIISVTFYEKILIPLLIKSNGNERGMSILQRIGIGMVMVIAAMVVSALVERKRLGIVKEEKSSLSMSAFWLVPQYMILGFADGFTLVGLQEYFYEEVPDSMRSLGIAFYLSVIGVGSFLSNALITVVDHITEKSGKSWIGKDLNISRLDNFYWILAAINVVNLCVYILVARSYNYKTVQRIVSEANGNNESIT